jgi:hypothetical protein
VTAYALDDKRRIVAAINRRYGTSVPVEVVEMAVASELTTWERLAEEEADCICTEPIHPQVAKSPSR